jgi:hypothetical protein
MADDRAPDTRTPDAPAPLRSFGPGVRLLLDAPEEEVTSTRDLSLPEAGRTAADEAEPPPPVVPEQEVHPSTLADRWREHVETDRGGG